jgi:hypothetical protein
MKIVSVAEGSATITISRDDLGFLQSAMNEALDALDDKELRLRTGETRERGRDLIQEIKAVREAIRNYK